MKKFAALLLFAALSSALVQTLTIAQQTQQQPQPAPAATATTDKAAKVHELLALMGTRDLLTQNIDAMIENGRQKLEHDHPALDPAFKDEWARRMKARIKVDDFVDVVAAVYARHFSADELVQLIALYHAAQSGQQPNVAPALRDKMSAEQSEIQAEIGAGLLELSEKIGSEVAQTVAADHPEYMKEPPPPPEQK